MMNHYPNFSIRNSLFDIRYSFLLVAATLAAWLNTASADDKPNIVLIVADDIGYADIGATGVKDIRTPNLDRLAREGTFFSDACVTGPICVPSRMGILWGAIRRAGACTRKVMATSSPASGRPPRRKRLPSF